MTSERIHSTSEDIYREHVASDGSRTASLDELSPSCTMASASGGVPGKASPAAPEKPASAPPPLPAPSVREEIRALVDRTPLVDTHEHLVDEACRMDPSRMPDEFWMRPVLTGNDFSVLFSHYADSDLKVAGMSNDDFGMLCHPDTDLHDKWRLVSPYYARTRNTAYLRNVRESIRVLYGEDDIREDNFESISDKLAAAVKPGLYEHILKDVCNIEYCQVNSPYEMVFMETEQPELLGQDLNIGNLSNRTAVSEELGRDIGSLKAWHDGIEEIFERCGPRAVAVKSAKAYERALDYGQVSGDAVTSLVDQMVAGKDLSPAESKAIEDHLFHFCVQQATEYNLPVKLHTGYLAGDSHMRLHRLRRHAGDVCELLIAYPDTTFDIFHITYTYQQEAIAMAKHFRNAHIDMCWAWIIDPVGSVQFLKQFLTAAPASKVFTFGGDYIPVELVPGHVSIARQGLAQTLTELVEEGWIDENEVEALAVRLMNGNAHEVFDHERTLKNW